MHALRVHIVQQRTLMIPHVCMVTVCVANIVLDGIRNQCIYYIYIRMCTCMKWSGCNVWDMLKVIVDEIVVFVFTVSEFPALCLFLYEKQFNRSMYVCMCPILFVEILNRKIHVASIHWNSSFRVGFRFYICII